MRGNNKTCLLYTSVFIYVSFIWISMLELLQSMLRLLSNASYIIRLSDKLINATIICYFGFDLSENNIYLYSVFYCDESFTKAMISCTWYKNLLFIYNLHIFLSLCYIYVPVINYVCFVFQVSFWLPGYMTSVKWWK